MQVEELIAKLRHIPQDVEVMAMESNMSDDILLFYMPDESDADRIEVIARL